MDTLLIFYLIGIIYLIDGVKDLVKSLKKPKQEETIVLSDQMAPSEALQVSTDFLKANKKGRILRHIFQWGIIIWLFVGFQLGVAQKYLFLTGFIWEIGWILLFGIVGIYIGAKSVMNMKKANPNITSEEIANTKQNIKPIKQLSLNTGAIQSIVQVFLAIAILAHYFKGLLY